jgi:DNA-binding NtrC family response regulator
MLSISEIAPAKTRALVVETDDDLRLTLRECLESCNLAVTSIRSGSEAISLLQSHNQIFDIVLTDLMMASGRTGLDILKAARQAHPACYVVVMTRPVWLDPAIQAIRFGAYDYLLKPFQIEELEAIVARIRQHILLIDENKRLAKRLEAVTDRFSSIGSRLERIESALSRLTTLAEGSRTLSF